MSAARARLCGCTGCDSQLIEAIRAARRPEKGPLRLLKRQHCPGEPRRSRVPRTRTQCGALRWRQATRHARARAHHANPTHHAKSYTPREKLHTDARETRTRACPRHPPGAVCVHEDGPNLHVAVGAVDELLEPAHSDRYELVAPDDAIVVQIDLAR
eukprot:332784-Prymnesium_polylepis.3